MVTAISKDFLRMVCAPYFEHMLEAVHQAVQQQQQQQQQDAASAAAASTFQQCSPYEEALTSDEGESGGAFSTLFSADSTPGVASNVSAEQHFQNRVHGNMCRQSGSSTAVDAAREGAKAHHQQVVSEAGHGKEKAIMVCRHWKAKGHCRMEAECKFLHPEHKRGIGLQVEAEGMDLGNALVGALPKDLLALSTVAGSTKSKRSRKKNNLESRPVVPVPTQMQQLPSYGCGGDAQSAQGIVASM